MTSLKVTINGEIHSLPAQSSVQDIIQRLNLQDKRIAIELNEDIVPRSQHAKTLLNNNDVLEIVTAIGGG